MLKLREEYQLSESCENKLKSGYNMEMARSRKIDAHKWQRNAVEKEG